MRAHGELALQSSVDCGEKGAIIATQLPYHNTAELASSHKIDLKSNGFDVVVSNPCARARIVQPRYARARIPMTREATA